MIKSVIFDWSGVILDDLKAVHRATMLLFQEFGVKELSLEEFKKSWIQPYMLFYNKHLINTSEKEERALFKRFYRKAVKEYPPRPFPGIKQALNRFKQAGVMMLVLSSNGKENIFKEKEMFGLEGLFDEINAEVHDKREVIEEILKRNCLDPGKTLCIGDTTHEVDAGRKAGSLTAAVTWGYQNRNVLESSKPDFLINNLKELEAIIFKK
jgi:phosphoglycolate phosphatase-like HAD superfamily hydrolase